MRLPETGKRKYENGPAVANVVPELPLADLGIPVAAREALRSVTAWWLIGPQPASEGRQS